tara:strand:+ start:1347 stop:1943 length:597 start_codon:yes stop_codon:yes gene_type:complete
MRKPHEKIVREVMPKEHKQKIIEIQDTILAMLEKVKAQFGKYSIEYKQLENQSNFLRNLIFDYERQKNLFLLYSLHKDIETRKITTINQLREIIKINRPEFIEQLKLSQFSKKNLIYNSIKRLEELKIIYRDPLISYVAEPRKKSKLGVFKINKEAVKEYFSIDYNTLIEETQKADLSGYLQFTPQIFSKEVVDKFKK